MDSVIQRSFGAGELAPALHARADLVKYAQGLRTCRNFLVKREGGVTNRPGLRYIATAKDNADNKFLFRYESEIGGSILIEAGNGYLRFYLNGARIVVSGVAAYNGGTAYVPGDLVLSGGTNYYCLANTTGNAPPNAAFWYALTGNIYEIPHPFLSHQFNWIQASNVLTLTHQDVAPQELIYGGNTNWVLRPITTTPSIGAPTAFGWVAGTPVPTDPALARTFAYRVSAAANLTYEESEACTAVTIAGAGAPSVALPNALSWTPPTGGAAEYYIYCDPYGNGTFGFIGTATGQATFNDTGFVPDFAVTPVIPRVLFNSANNYPGVAAYYQQRRLFASSANEPDTIWASRVGFHSNFGISSPLQDDDALTFRIVGNRQQVVRWLLGLKSLVVLGSNGEWTVGQPETPLVPQGLSANQQLYVGATDKRPSVIGASVIYLQIRGSVFREAKFQAQIEGLAGTDLTLFSSHLFDGYTFFRYDYQQTPLTVLWCVRSDGTLLGLTYIPEQDVWGWHRHDSTNGSFEDVCVVPEGTEDVPYVLMKRTIGGATVRYIEKLESRQIVTWDTDVFFVDAGLSYSGAAATVFTGLDHLNGQVVAVVADGSVVFNGDSASASAAFYTVAGGRITIPTAATNVHIGLPIRYPEIELLDLDTQGTAIRDKRKRVGSLAVLLEASSRSFLAGPDEQHLRQMRVETFEPTEDAHTGQVTLNMTSAFNDYGRVLIRQTDPLPLTILGVIPSLELGG